MNEGPLACHSEGAGTDALRWSATEQSANELEKGRRLNAHNGLNSEVLAHYDRDALEPWANARRLIWQTFCLKRWNRGLTPVG